MKIKRLFPYTRFKEIVSKNNRQEFFKYVLWGETLPEEFWSDGYLFIDDNCKGLVFYHDCEEESEFQLYFENQDDMLLFKLGFVNET